MKHEEILKYGFRRLILGQPEQLWYIDDVPNGSNCECVCPSCREELIARNKGKHNVHHFAHVSGKTCRGARMSALHALAQEVIQEDHKVMLPEYKKKFVQHDAKLQVFDEVSLEKPCIDEVSRRRPDCIGKVLSDGIEIWIEIYCTNQINEERRADIIRRKQYCIEINFSDLLSTDYTKESVRERLLNNSNDREWICHPVWDKEEAEKNEKERLKREAIAAAIEKRATIKTVQESKPETSIPQFTGNTSVSIERWHISDPKEEYKSAIPENQVVKDWLMWIKYIYGESNGKEQFYKELQKEYMNVNFRNSHPFVVNDAETKINELLVAVTVNYIAPINQLYLEFLIVLRIIEYLNRYDAYELGKTFVENEQFRNVILNIIKQLQNVTKTVQEQSIKAMPVFQDAESKEAIMQILTICNIVK